MLNLPIKIHIFKKNGFLEVVMARVLVVDDSKTSRKFLVGMLVNAGHEVVGEAVDGVDGVKKYQELRPDVVTMDITMPKLDGIDAVSEIVKIDPDAKVIMVTAAGQKTNIVEALKRGAADFIQKPFEDAAILSVIEKVMEE
jgi:two-component system chemotaxis response regulator CheY